MSRPVTCLPYSGSPTLKELLMIWVLFPIRSKHYEKALMARKVNFWQQNGHKTWDSLQYDLVPVGTSRSQGCVQHDNISLVILHRSFDMQIMDQWPTANNYYLTHYHTMPHFDALNIYSCGKPDEKLLVTSNFSLSYNVFYPIWHLFFILNALQNVVCNLFQIGPV